MISPEGENIAVDNIEKMTQIRDELRGRYYTIEEMSEMSGVPVDHLKTLFNMRRSSSFWAQVCIKKSDRVQIQKAGSSINYYCPYSASRPASKKLMQSAEDRAANLDSRPTICPPGRRFGSLASHAFRSELMEMNLHLMKIYRLMMWLLYHILSRKFIFLELKRKEN